MEDENVIVEEKSARQARREKIEAKARSKSEASSKTESEKSGASILSRNSRRSTPILLNPYESLHFPRTYYERIPEWRIRAGHSAHEPHWRDWKELQVVIFAMTFDVPTILYFPLFAAALGRGTFVLAFIVTEFLIGYPLIFFELAIGQFSATDVVRAFSIFPLAEGVGMSFILISIVQAITFNFHLTWFVYFIYLLCDSMAIDPNQMSWDDCSLTDAKRRRFIECVNLSPALYNDTHFLCTASVFRDVSLKSGAKCATAIESNHSELDLIVLVISGLVVAFSIFFAHIRGIKSLGRFVFWTTPIAFLIMLVLLIGILSNKGAMDGILYLFTPAWGEISVMQFLTMVTIHVLRSCNLSTGTMIVVGSYAQFDSPTHYHALATCVGNVVFTLMSACIVFGLMGIAAHNHHLGIDDLVSLDTFDLDMSVFTIMTLAVDCMWCPLLWATLFFFIITWSTITSQICGILVFLMPVYHTISLTEVRRLFINGLALIAIFLLTLPLITGNGVVLYQLSFAQRLPLQYHSILVMLSAVGFITYGYSLQRLSQDVDFMTGRRPNKFVCIAWMAVPPVLFVLFISSLVLMYINGPGETNARKLWIGWALGVLSVIPIPAFAIWNLFEFRRRGRRFFEVLHPRDEWKWNRSRGQRVSLSGPPSVTMINIQLPKSAARPDDVIDPASEQSTGLVAHPLSAILEMSEQSATGSDINNPTRTRKDSIVLARQNNSISSK